MFFITNRETISKYTYLFTEMIFRYIYYFGIAPIINDIISDGSKVAAGACEKVFGVNIRRQTCYFHFKKK